LHIARQDSIPMILFIGQVQRDAREREAFQEVEYRRAFTEFAKWVGEIDDARRIPEFVTRAFAVATSGRPGPVVLTLPEDMLVELVDAPEAKPYTPVEAHPGTKQIKEFAKLLGEAKRPMFIIGGTRWDEQAVANFQTFAEKFALPVGCSFRRQMLFNHLHSSYAGDVGIGINPALAKEIKEADLIVLLGARMSEMPSSSYTLLNIPYPSQKLIHIYPEAEELGRIYRPDLAIVASSKDFVDALSDLEAPDAPVWTERTKAMHERHRPRQVRAMCRWVQSWIGLKRTLAKTRSSPMALVITPLGCTASTASRAITRSPHRPPALWVMACQPLLPPSRFSQSAKLSALRVMAAS
jgi:acetolactate synthase-1/2/3 large subunit